MKIVKLLVATAAVAGAAVAAVKFAPKIKELTKKFKKTSGEGVEVEDVTDDISEVDVEIVENETAAEVEE